MHREAVLEKTNEAILNRVFPGGVIGIVHKDGTREIIPFGTFTYDSNSPVIREDSIYDVASITKSIPTASLALQLIDEGKLKLTDKLIDHIPEFRNSDRELVTIKHLLTYTLDGYGLGTALNEITKTSLKGATAKQLLETLMTHDFEKRPGTVFKYSNIPAVLLGMVVERIYNQTLDVLAKERFFGPLAMTRTTFYPEKFLHEEIAPTEIDDWRGLVHGIVHDESAYIAKQDGVVMGHAGLFSTAPDILTFLQMLLHGGTYQGKRFFSSEIIKLMQTNQIPELNDFTGLGWELNQPRYMGEHCSSATFGKTGFTGTLCVCDIKKEIAYVILTNRTFPKRTPDSTAINSFRKEVGEIILSATSIQ